MSQMAGIAMHALTYPLVALSNGSTVLVCKLVVAVQRNPH